MVQGSFRLVRYHGKRDAVAFRLKLAFAVLIFAHRLRDAHRAELRAAHRAEFRVLKSIVGQFLVVHFPRGFGIK